MRFKTALTAAALSAGAASAAISIDGYTDATNDRFTNNAAFVLAGFDLSGVGQATGGRYATAISRNVLLSAQHFAPSGTVVFYPTNDPNGASVSRTVAGAYRVPGTDHRLLLLDRGLPASIAHYPIATEPLSGPVGPVLQAASAGAYQGVNACMTGRSPSAFAPPKSQAVGRNLVSGYAENMPVSGYTNADVLLLTDDATNGPNHVQFEALLQDFDSGGPLFAVEGGRLRLLGTNFFTYTSGTFQGLGAGSAVSYTGNAAGAILDYIRQHACTGDLTTTNANPGDPGYAEPDGQVDGADLSFYVENWLAQQPIADVTTTNANPGDLGYGQSDGTVDGADLSYFVEAWLAGCP